MAKGVENIFTGREGARAHARQARPRSPPMCFAVRHVPFRCVLLSVRPVLLSIASCYPLHLARQFSLPSIASCLLAACLPSRLGRWSVVFPRVLLPSAAWLSPGKAKIRGEWLMSVCEGGLTSKGGEGVVWRSKKKTRRENFCSST